MNEMSSSDTGAHTGKRVAAKWSTRDKLCLVTAVASLGNQNWLEIGQCMQTMCLRSSQEQGVSEVDGDMFSKTNCALEYERILGDPEFGLEMDTSITSKQLNLKCDRLIEIRTRELKDAIQQGQEVS